MDLRLLTSTDSSVTSGAQQAGDLDFSTGDLVLLDGAEFARQQVQIRLQFFLGEWFLDLNEGLPYFQQVLIKNPDASILDDIFRQAILGAQSILSLNRLNFDFDGPSRVLSISFEAQVVGDTDLLVFDQEFVINV
jgi:hypothetical protein